MKRSFYGLLGFAVFAINIVAAMPAFAGNPSKNTGELQSACSTLGGHFSVSNGSSSGLSWTCNGMKTSGTSSNTGPLQSACSTMGGNFSVSGADSSGAKWTCKGASAAGTADNGTGGGSGGSGSSAQVVTVDNGKPTTNDCGGAKTSLIKCNAPKDGSAIFNILGIALTIATYGVGAAAVVGVVITGYQYMTARDNAGQVVKAKNRLLQVVIGLAIWVLFWGVLQFLLPGGLFANGS